MRFPVFLKVFSTFLLFILPGFQAAALEIEGPQKKESLYLSSQNIQWDKEKNIIHLKGHVIFFDTLRTFYADEGIWDKNANTVVLKGHVFFVDQQDNFAEIGDVRIAINTLESETQKAALTMQREDGFTGRVSAQKLRVKKDVYEMETIRYSYCAVPKTAGDRQTWSIEAARAVYDSQKKVTTYYDAVLKIFDIPVFYIPRLSKSIHGGRYSGFLPPHFSSKTNIGQYITFPFFIALGQNANILYTPAVPVGNQGSLIHNMSINYLNARLSLAADGYFVKRKFFSTEAAGGLKESSKRWSDNIKGQWRLSPYSKIFFQHQNVSDETFVRFYEIKGLEDLPFLTSNLQYTRLDGTSQIDIFKKSYFNMRQNVDSTRQPDIFMHGGYKTFSTFTDNLFLNEVSLDADRFERLIGMTTNRFSLNEAFYVTPQGTGNFNFQLIAGGQLNYYRVGLGRDPLKSAAFLPAPIKQQNKISYTVNTFVPWGGLKLSKTFYSFGENSQITLTPLSYVYFLPKNPYGKKDLSLIPNEDSTSLSLNDSNVFALNKYSGQDRFIAGHHADYGLEFHYTDPLRNLYALIGQNYRLTKNISYPEGSGLEKALSDYILRLGYTQPLFHINYALRLDSTRFQQQENIISALIGDKTLQLSASYSRNAAIYDPLNMIHIDYVKSASFGLQTYLTASMILKGDATYKLDRPKSISEASGSFLYQGCCLVTQLTLKRSFLRDRDILPNTSLAVMFKLIGLQD